MNHRHRRQQSHSITIFQHCNANENIKVKNFFIEQNNADLSSLYLPEEYASILPTPGGKPEPPIYLHESTNTVSSEKGLSQGWVDKLSKFTADIPPSFSAYFSNNIELIHMGITRSTLLPLIDEEIATPATIRYCMRIVKGITEKLSAGQSSVITGDQPVYTLGKQMQWMYPSEFENVMWTMGPLHIEMAFMAVIGDWLTGFGWDTILVKSSINTAGRAQSFFVGE